MGDLGVILGMFPSGQLKLTSRFVFFALNTKLRAEAQREAQLFIKTAPGAADLTVEDLRQWLDSERKESFLKSVRRSIDWIPSLMPFWQHHRSQLIQIIEQVGSPHLFFTLSAADLHWPQLHRIIEQQRALSTGNDQLDLDTLDEKARYDRCVDNLTKFPHLASSFLQQCVKLFLKTLSKVGEFEFVDHWYRYEWQHRGSGHVHGFLWLRNGPDLDKKDINNPEHCRELAQFFSNKVFAHSPIPNLERPAVNPCRLSGPVEGKDNRTDVAELLNRCQRHSKCAELYCVQYNKRHRAKMCRFGFPKPVCPEPKIEQNQNQQWTFFPYRPDGDINMNDYHPLWTALWRGNIDVSPMLSKNAAIIYISKYASKAQTMSAELDKTILDLMNGMPDTDGIQLVITKTLNKFCIKRDFSAQEACHQILGLPMVECSRSFDSNSLPVDLTVTRVLRAGRRRQNNSDVVGLQAAQQTSSSKMEKYMVRSDELKDVSYLDMVRMYKWRGQGWQRRRKDAVVSIYLKKWYEALQKDPSKPQNGQHGQTFATAARRAVMLYVPFKSLEDAVDMRELVDQFGLPPFQRLPYDETAGAQNDLLWENSFRFRMIKTPEVFPEWLCILFHGTQSQDGFVDVDSDEEWEPTPDFPRRREEEWQATNRVLVDNMVGQPRDFFGNRDIDLLHNWGADLLEYDLPANLETFIETQKQLNERERVQEIVRPDMLNDGQRKVYDYVLNGFSNSIETNAPRLENVIVMGKGGVGKSFLIRSMEHGIWQLMMARYGHDEYPNVRTAVKLAAFTGKAAFQVGGVTIHSLLCLRPNHVGSAQPLSPEALRRVQEVIQT